MECSTCPYGCEDFARRLEYDPQNTITYCEKVGGRTDLFGRCGDVNIENVNRKNNTKAKVINIKSDKTL